LQPSLAAKHDLAADHYGNGYRASHNKVTPPNIWFPEQFKFDLRVVRPEAGVPQRE
ncbi:hypothetical protein HispidOSU_018668, partial [Sigmodon hispidus]